MCKKVDYDKLTLLVENFNCPKTSNRVNASGLKCLTQWGKSKDLNRWDRVGYRVQSINFGLVRKKFNINGNVNYPCKPIDQSANNLKYPEIYDELKKIINDIDPQFEYDSITLNKNFKCRPHYDKANRSPSLIVAFGKFLGGELVVNDCEFDIYHRPLIFNGGNSLHYTLEWIGERYSAVFYKLLKT